MQNEPQNVFSYFIFPPNNCQSYILCNILYQLGELAEMISISSHNLSEVINTKTGMIFFDFINQYRIEEVKREIRKPENENLTLLAVSMDSCFNSKTSFNTLFKKYVGITPSQYKDSLKSD